MKRKPSQLHHQNPQEVEADTLFAEHLQEEDISYRIITPYDAQWSALEQALDERIQLCQLNSFSLSACSSALILYNYIARHISQGRAFSENGLSWWIDRSGE
jgi:hypothetical protein